MKIQNGSSSGLWEQLSSWTLYALVFLLPLLFAPNTFDVFGVPKITFLRIISLILLILTSARIAVTKEIRTPKGMLFFLTSGFFALLILATIFSIDPTTSLLGLRKRFFGLTTYLPLFIIFFTAWIILWNSQKLESLFLIILTSAVIVSLIGVAQALGSTFPLDLKKNFGWKAWSTLGNPNFTGIYLTMVFPLGVGLLFHLEEKNKKAFVFMAVIVVIAGIIATGSTGALIGGVTATVLFFTLYFRLFRFFKTKLLPALLVTALVVAMVVGAGFYFSKVEARGFTQRQMGWVAASKLIGKHPLLGIGLDTMRFKVSETMPLKKGFYSEIFEDAHNIFLTTGVTAGLPALLLFLALCFLAFRNSGVAVKKHPEIRALLLGLEAALGGYILAEQVNPDDIIPLTFFWFFLAIIGSLSLGMTQFRIQRPITMQAVRLATVGITALALILIVLSFYPFLAEFHLLKAEDASLENGLREYRLVHKYNPYYNFYFLRPLDRISASINQKGDYPDWFPAQAISFGKKAVRITPLDADNYMSLGLLYHNLGAKTGERRYYYKTIALYNEALKRNRYHLFAIYDLVQSYHAIGDRKNALKWVNIYLSLADSKKLSNLKSQLELKSQK